MASRGLRIGYGAGSGGALFSDSDFDIEGSGTSPTTATLGSTPASGHSLIVLSAADLSTIGTPTDNKGNTLTLAQSQTYPSFPSYGFRMHTKAAASGGAGHVVSLTKTSNTAGESTLIAFMAPGSTISLATEVFRSAAGAGGALTSNSLTLGAGTWRLFSLWSGDGSSGTNDQTCNPDTGWTNTEFLFIGQTAYIQASLAVRDVTVGAGTYTHTWRPVENQGGIVMLGAIGI